MTDDHGSDFESLPTAPPTEAGERPEHRSSWPNVIGIIAIVFGSMAALGSCFAIGALLFLDQYADIMNSFQAQAGQGEAWEEMVAIMDARQLIFLALGFLALFLAGLLLAGGIALIRRRPSARGLLLGWSLAKMAMAVTEAWAEWPLTKASYRAQAANENMPEGFRTAMESIAPVVASCTFLWYAALPVFLLIWFNRGKVRSEMSSW